ncbi:MAG TPA: DUF3011 domain-containing protein [Longimicrobium sp.]|nr:DUF3011 domain-containing protein [Longimicrobium sp.]
MYKLACLAVVAAALSAIPGTANAQTTVTCESSRGRRETCRVDTRGEVRLVQQLSDARCVRGRTWGTVPGAVWVDDGCRGRFASYGSSRGGYDGRNGGYGGRDGRYDHGRNGRWDNDRNGRHDDRNGSWAVERCRQAVRREIGNRRLNLWMENNSSNNARVGWRADRGQSGSCRVDRNGRVDVRYDRRR